MYENVFSQNDYDEQTYLKDKIVSIVLSQQISIMNKNREELLGLIRYDEDEETSINYMQRMNELYSSIEDILIKLNKLKEALLVTERHRSKICKDLTNLNDLLSFEQIETLIRKENINILIYFSYTEISSKLNCWLMMPKQNILKFNQISSNLFDDLIYLLFDKIKSAEEQDQTFLLQNIYNLIIKPFEIDLFNEVILVNELSDNNNNKNTIKPSLFIIYDENMFKLPFHLLKITSDLILPNFMIDTKEKFLFEFFEINSNFSIKLIESNGDVTRQINSEPNNPMRVISNENEMENLFKSNYRYNLLILLVNSEHTDISALNTLVNNLLCKKMCNSILLEFNYAPTNKNAKQELIDSELNAKQFLKNLYAKLDKNKLQPSLIFETLKNQQNKNQQQLLNYLLFGNLNNFISIDFCVKNDLDLEDLILELDLETDQITFSQIVVQFLKLNLKFEPSFTILNIVITVVIYLYNILSK